ncbi:MAG: HEAT repeat domain-containing protein [Cystobacterineae bacterium]|nr:HEAT repeat domain-containing protein [Cystobacterineae bacterium]
MLLFWWLGFVSLENDNTTRQMQEAHRLIREVQQKTLSPVSASNRMEVLGIQKTSAALLMKVLQNPMEIQTRYRLVELLALLSQSVSARYFLDALEGEDVYLRMLAAKALGPLQHKEALPSLVNMLLDPRLALRREAATALGRLKLKQAMEPLLAALHVEAEPEVRKQMLWALGMLNDKKSLSSIQRFLTHSSEATRWAAAQALLAMGEHSGWEWLKPHLNSPEDSECDYALLSLEEVVPSPSWKKEALGLLHNIMQKRQASLAARAAVVAVHWKDRSAQLWLERKVEQSEGDELGIYEKALNRVRELLANSPTPKEKRL